MTLIRVYAAKILLRFIFQFAPNLLPLPPPCPPFPARRPSSSLFSLLYSLATRALLVISTDTSRTLSLQSLLPRLPLPNPRYQLAPYLQQLCSASSLSSLPPSARELLASSLGARTPQAPEGALAQPFDLRPLLPFHEFLHRRQFSSRCWLDALWSEHHFLSRRESLLSTAIVVFQQDPRQPLPRAVPAVDRQDAAPPQHERSNPAPSPSAQIDAAARLISALASFALQLRTQALPIDMLPAAHVPLCMHGYSHVFGTRIPGFEADSLQPTATSDTVVVLSPEGHFYALPLRRDPRSPFLSVSELHQALLQITLHSQLPSTFSSFSSSSTSSNSSSSSSNSSSSSSSSNSSSSSSSSSFFSSSFSAAHLCALTAAPRSVWAQTRHACFLQHPVNARSLGAIESALFVLRLAPLPPSAEPPAALCCAALGLAEQQCQWLDKSLQCTVFPDGSSAATLEQSQVSAHVAAQLWHHISGELRRMPADAGCEPPCSAQLPAVPFFSKHPAQERAFLVNPNDCKPPASESSDVSIAWLRWADPGHLRPRAHEAIGYAVAFKDTLRLASLRLQLPPLDPQHLDAFVQLLIQLARARTMAGGLDEQKQKKKKSAKGIVLQSVPLRMFYHGREDMLLCRHETVEAWVGLMLREGRQEGGGDQKKAAFSQALRAHQQQFLEISRGRGLWNYLRALYFVSPRTGDRQNKLLSVVNQLQSEPDLISTNVSSMHAGDSAFDIVFSPIETRPAQLTYSISASGQLRVWMSSNIQSNLDSITFLQSFQASFIQVCNECC